MTDVSGTINFGASSHVSVPAGTASPGKVAATTAPSVGVDGITPYEVNLLAP